MASIWALRALLGASLGLGALDLAWVNLAIAPRVLASDPGAPASTAEAVASTAEAVPPRDPAPARPAPAPPAPAPPAPALARATVVAPGAEVAPPAAARSPVDAPPRHERVYFATSSVWLDPKARARLARLASSLGPEATLVLEGHADHRGAEAFNRTLSRRRAVAVQAALEALGVARARIEVGYLGEAEVRAEAALWRDRRVDIQITGGSR